MKTHLPNPRLFVLALMTLAFALPATLPLNAQDITIGTPVTLTGPDDSPPKTVFKLTRSTMPKYPDALRDTGTYGYAIAFSPVKHNRTTKRVTTQRDVTAISVKGNATDKEIESSCFNSLHDWQWEAKNYQQDDPRRAWVAIIFNPASASGSKKNTAPRLLNVVPVFLPIDRIRPDDSVAQADVAVGVSGEIKSVKITTPNKFTAQYEAAITDTVSKWKIAPARANGISTEATINVPILLISGRFPTIQDRVNDLANRSSAAKAPDTPATRQLEHSTDIAKSESRPEDSTVTQLTVIKPVAAVFPKSAGNSIGESASVTVEFTLDDDGYPQNPVVVLSPNKKLDVPALKAIRAYWFKKPDPAKPDSLGNTYAKLSDARWQYEVNFWKPAAASTATSDPVNTALTTPGRHSSRVANRYSAASGAPPVVPQSFSLPNTYSSTPSRPIRATSAAIRAARQANRDSPEELSPGQNITWPVFAPESVKAVAPVYPYFLLKRRVTGGATVRQSRVPDGTNEPPEVINASKKDFGLALAAALRFYDITPAHVMGQPAAAMLNASFDFNPANPDLRLPEKTLRLLADETQHPEKIIPEDNLDGRLKIQRNAPGRNEISYNDVLKGSTIIEFLVDETGQVHLPRIIKTSVQEAAYVLMQQISMRAYDPPMQNGKPVVARARETMTFDAKGK